MSSDAAIKVRDLSKCFQIYDAPQDRLRQFVLPRIQRLLGLPQKSYFREFWALRNISFEVQKRETIGIIGLNGSGKSTLLKLICGTLGESSGSAEYKGRVAALLELGTGFNPEFSGKENVYLNASILGLSREEINRRYDSIVAFADIGEFIDQPVKNYSSGMYVRLAFAVIANVDADILIVDEALAVGDVLFSQKCMRFLREFKERGTILFVSHNSGAVVNLCDRAIWLEKGQLQSIGPAKTVCEQYLARRYRSKHDAEPQRIREKIDNGNGSTAADTAASLDSHRDMRMKFINNSNLRNDLRVLAFDGVKNSFGNGGASVSYAGLEDLQGKRISWMVGGEPARIVVEATALTDCSNLIIGFNLKDRLGQVLIGQNTYLDTCLRPVKATPGQTIRAEFTFRFPILPRGSYAVDVAVADGEPPDVTQLQWVHDAFVLDSQTSSTVNGLIGIAFDRIELWSIGTKNERE
jgi:lipopolysaccharide transport system ATP-binding protein